MGRIQLPPSNHENIKIENATINHLQRERTWLTEHLLYLHSVDNLLVTWSNNIRQIALDTVPTTKGARWMTMWLRNLESRLNNYKCASDWFNDFQALIPGNINIELQRLIAYILLEKTIRIALKQVHNDQVIRESWTIPKIIIDLESAEASKFQYIIGWTIYKLTKSDTSTMAHKDFAQIRSCLNILSAGHVEYVRDIRSKITTVIQGLISD